MSLLTGPEIKKQVEAGNIVLDPFDPKRLGPNSYDLELAPTLKRYHALELDMRKAQSLDEMPIPVEGFVLEPGRLYLGSTIERAGSNFFAPMLSGRSSLARLGVSIHVTAGFGDVGFTDKWTLEITAVQRVRIYAGIRVAQVYFETLDGEIQLYKGKYNGQTGPTASEMWRELT